MYMYIYNVYMLSVCVCVGVGGRGWVCGCVNVMVPQVPDHSSWALVLGSGSRVLGCGSWLPEFAS